MTRILITGSCGFVGHHVVEWYLEKTDWEILGLDSFRHAGDSLRALLHPRYSVFCHDLNAPLSDRLLAYMGDIDYILNLASISDVDLSISDPLEVWENNTRMIGNILEVARKKKVKSFLQCSTDEVFGPAPEGYFHKEWETAIPSNPYSASKAAQEALCIAYWRTYGVPVIITNCFSMDSRIMTDSGLLGYDKIEEGDLVFTLDENENLIFTPVIEKVKMRGPEKMVRIKSPKVDQLVTPNHRMMVRECAGKPRRWGVIKVCQAETMVKMKGRIRVPTTGNWKGFSEFPKAMQVTGVSDENLASILGWYVSEGCTMEKNGISFGSGSKKQTDTLIHLLSPIGKCSTSTLRQVRIYNSKLRLVVEEFGKGAENKYLPYFVKSLSKDLLRIFLDSAIDGDGTRYRTKQVWATVYYTKSKRLAEDMAEIGMKVGYAVRICKRKTWNPRKTVLGESYIVRFRNPEADIESRNVTEVLYNDDVWCVKTETGRVFVERNGIISLSGQTMNMIGERQEPTKFLPRIIGSVLHGRELVIHGSPERVGSRMYLDSKNLADAWLFLLRKHEPAVYSDSLDVQRPSRFNIVGQEEISNLDLARRVADIMVKPLIYRLEDFHQTRPGHDRRYALDGSHIREQGWKHPIELEESLRRIIAWSMEHPEWLL